MSDMNGEMLGLESIGKVYTEGAIHVRAVSDVSLKIKSSEVVLIMGPSGSGKTTLLSMMGCILRPTEGRITVGGRVVGDLNETEMPDVRKRYYGFVFQSYNLFPSLTAAENVSVVLRLKGCPRSKLKQEALGLLDMVGLGDRAGFYPADLSGGQKQRVAFARALAGDPPIILADEPTANLDSATGREVLSMLKSHATGQGKAVVIVSHDPKAQSFADRVIYMEDGRLRS